MRSTTIMDNLDINPVAGGLAGSSETLHNIPVGNLAPSLRVYAHSGPPLDNIRIDPCHRRVMLVANHLTDLE